jgi:tetratricopeptide (TPR) repeat protein
MKKLVFVLFFATLTSLSSFAQKTYELLTPEETFYQAQDLFAHEKYVAAKAAFEAYIGKSNATAPYRIDAEYYQGLCAMNLFHPDAEFLLTTFVRNHPDSHWKQSVYLELGNFKYKSKNYKQCLEWFNQVEERQLLVDEQPSFYYKRGYAQFNQKQFKESRVDFAKVKDGNSEFAPAATYYYSYMAYTAQDYQVALEGFSKLKEDKDFKAVVPYFISQILYLQKKYDELLAYAPALISSEENVKNNYPNANEEIAHLVGDAYFIQKDYAHALPFLEKYHNSPAAKPSAEDYYQLGFTYYSTGNFQKALDAYSNCTKDDNALSQLANYNMGDCYLKLEQKEYARTAFEAASKQTFNQEIQEDALFNYAKLAFELSYNPFHEAITAFEDYLQKYPDSPRHDEAYSFLLNVYLKTRNYERALESLDKIKVKDISTKSAYQVVAFNRGVELYQAESFARAADFFNKSLQYPQSPTLVAQTKYWLAEMQYKQGNYAKAKELYQACIAEPAAFNSDYYGLAQYGLGYTFFKMGLAQKDYEDSKAFYANANSAFRKFVEVKEADVAKVSDAYLRIGDCFFVSKSYKQAIEAYGKGSNGQKDYINYQKALCYGYEGDLNKKVELLAGIVNSNSNSRYKTDAAFELGDTYLEQEKYGLAKSTFLELLADEPNTLFARRIWVDLCLIYREEGNTEKLKESWNKLYAEYKNDKIILDALAIVKPELIDDPEFQNQLKNLSIANVSESEIENDIFNRASALAYSGDCGKARPKLEAYLAQYTKPLNEAEANYLIANCYLTDNNREQAIVYFERVLELPTSDFTEEALNNAADIRMEQGEYAKAINHLLNIETAARSKNAVAEARMALLTCYFNLNEMGLAREYADKVISDASSTAENKATAYLWRARIKMSEEEFDAALVDYKEVAKQGGQGAAEAAFQGAFVEYKKGDLVNAEKSVFKVIEKYASFEKWKYEAFLLLVDIYIAKPDFYQARKTLDAITAKVTNPDILARAEAKRQEIIQLENPAPINKSLEVQPDNNEEILNEDTNEE